MYSPLFNAHTFVPSHGVDNQWRCRFHLLVDPEDMLQAMHVATGTVRWARQAVETHAAHRKIDTNQFMTCASLNS